MVTICIVNIIAPPTYSAVITARKIVVNFYYRLKWREKRAKEECCYIRGAVYSTSCCIKLWTGLYKGLFISLDLRSHEKEAPCINDVSNEVKGRGGGVLKKYISWSAPVKSDKG